MRNCGTLFRSLARFAHGDTSMRLPLLRGRVIQAFAAHFAGVMVLILSAWMSFISCSADRGRLQRGRRMLSKPDDVAKNKRRRDARAIYARREAKYLDGVTSSRAANTSLCCAGSGFP